MSKKVQYTTNDPSASTDYLAADNTWKPMSGGGGGVPTTRTITINGTTQDLSANRTWLVGDMLQSVYDTDVDGVVDSAERIQIVVRNSTGSTLTKGQIVYLSGATGNRPNALLAQANTEATSSKTIGMVIADIPNNTDGQIAVNGTLHDINTSSFTAGDVLWLSATTAGKVVANTPPAEPNHTVFIGYVARAHPTQGRVVLAIQNGYELDELHGVQITTPSNGQVLTYNSTSGLWVNSNPASSFGSGITVTPPTGSGANQVGVIVSGSNTNGGTNYVDFLKATNTASGATNINKYFRLNSTGALEIVNSAYNATILTLTDAGLLNGASTTEMSYLSGVTSNIQTQLNSKVSSGGGASFVLISVSATGLGAGITRYYWNGGAGGTTVETQLRTLMPDACSCSRLYVRTTSTQPATGSQVITLLKNGVATSLSITIAAGSASGTFTDLSNTATFIAGDGYAVSVTNNASLTGAVISGISFKLVI